MNTNAMKAKLKAGQPVFGVQVDADWPEFVEMVRRHCGQWDGGPAAREDVREAPGSARP